MRFEIIWLFTRGTLAHLKELLSKYYSYSMPAVRRNSVMFQTKWKHTDSTYFGHLQPLLNNQKVNPDNGRMIPGQNYLSSSISLVNTTKFRFKILRRKVNEIDLWFVKSIKLVFSCIVWQKQKQKKMWHTH